MALATISDPPSTDAEYDVGDPQFWINRRVACITGQYPPNEADYVSIQEYVCKLEAELTREKTAVYDMVEACKRAEAERDAWKRQAGHHTAIEIERLRTLLREALQTIYELVQQQAMDDPWWTECANRINVALKEKS